MLISETKPLLFVEEEWVNGNTCISSIPIFERERARKIIAKMRTAFLEKLRNLGFEITTNRNDVTADTIYFVMDQDAICDQSVPLHIYKKQFDQRMFEAGGEELNYPYSLTMEEFFSHPFFPAVLKNEFANGGKDKFLIETSEQLDIIKKFYFHFKDNPLFANEFQCTIFQQLIETPTEFETYLRVLMSASGDVMGASLKYATTSPGKVARGGIYEQYFCDQKSEYFLNCKDMFHYYSNGENISFCQPRYSLLKQEILEAHGINKDHPMVPDQVLKAASNIMQACNRELGIICGFDFIMNVHDGKWYYLENQAFPAINEWADTKHIKLRKTGNADFYLKVLELELEARYEALMLYINKKSQAGKQLKKELNL